VRIFYSPAQKHLIVTPFRNGSTHLFIYKENYKLIQVQEAPIIEQSEAFTNIIDKVEKKTFIYRDPFLRLISYYNNFIYEPFAYKQKIRNISDNFTPFSVGKDLVSDMILAIDKIEKNYKNDYHTLPQYEFFKNKSLNQNIEEYTIISITQYTKWITQTFIGSIPQYMPSKINKIYSETENRKSLHIIYDMCKRIYKEDYEFLEPRITLI